MLYYQKRDANGLQIYFLIPNLKEDYADYSHGEHVSPPMGKAKMEPADNSWHWLWGNQGSGQSLPRMSVGRHDLRKLLDNKC